MEARELQRTDEARYQRLRKEAAKESSWKRTGELQRELELFERGVDGAIAVHEASGTRMWGAFHESHLAGTACLSEVRLSNGVPQPWLWGLYVVPKFRGTPASRCLMTAVQDWGESHYPGGVIMGAFDKGNRHAWQLVERFGFRFSDQRSDAEAAGLIAADEVLVECSNRNPRRGTDPA